ncbi:histidine kinase [bacterium SCSIO 12741]|nr:histidine kinase [bacterium SCSIO 12741]
MRAIATDADFIGRDQFGEGRVYDMHVDERGVLWILGNGGDLYTYSGGSKTTRIPFSTNSPRRLYTALHSGYQGKIWLSSLYGIAYVENDSIYELSIPEPYSDKWTRGFEAVYSDSSGTLHLAPRGFGYYTVSKDGEFTEQIGRKDGLRGHGVLVLGDGRLFNFYVTDPIQKSLSRGIYWIEKDAEPKLILVTNENTIYETSLVQHADSSYSFSIGNQLIIRFKSGKLIEEKNFPHKVIKLFTDSRNDLWIGTLDQGIFRAKGGSFSDMDHFRSEASEAVVTEGQNGGLWIKSSQKGFGFIAHPSAPHYSERNGFPEMNRVSDFTSVPGGVIAVMPDTFLLRIEKDSITTIRLPDEVSGKEYRQYPVYVVFNDKTGELWVSYSSKVMVYDGSNWRFINLSRELIGQRYLIKLAVLNDGTVVGATTKNLVVVSAEEPYLISNWAPWRITDFIEDPEGTIWVASDKGLWKLENEVFVRPFDEIPEELTKLNFDFIWAHDRLWFSTLDYGFMNVDRTGDFNIAKNKDGSNLFLIGYCTGPDGNIWSRWSSVSGYLCRIGWENDQPQMDYLHFDNLASRDYDMFSFVIQGDYLFYGSKEGVFIQKTNEILPVSQLPSVLITDVGVNNKRVGLKDSYELDYFENDLYFTFSGLSYSMKELDFRYQLLGQDSSWVPSEYENVRYTNLPSGAYTFKVQAKLKGAFWGESTIVQINIRPPFWETWWFRIGVVVAALFGLFGIIRWRTDQVKKLEQRKAKLVTERAYLELKALKAQINPHFIFNSISSVSYYMLENDSVKAESYLKKFARLMRLVLENSDKNAISLRGELSMLEHYVDLESERFSGDRIELILEFGELDLDEIQIPPSLLQPYVENAVRHGLKDKLSDRKIWIKGRREGENLILTVEDNGIGRKAASLKPAAGNNHRSYGILVATRRIEALNMDKQSQFEVEDVISPEGDVLGTKVTFSIPLVISKTIN